MTIAKDAIDGLQCSWCGTYFEKEHGYPVLCNDCWESAIEKHGNEKVMLHNFGVQKSIYKEL